MSKVDDGQMDVDRQENTEETADLSTGIGNETTLTFQLNIQPSNDFSSVHQANRENPVWEACWQNAKVPNKEDMLYSFIYWKYWQAWVHIKCYGENNQLYRCKAKNSEWYDIMFIWDKWEYTRKQGIKNNQIQWILCYRGNGIMKRIKIENSKVKTVEFWHVVWGFYWDKIEIRDLSLMKFYRKENDIVPFKYENKWWFCSSNNGFMLSCDRSTCKQWCHPSWMNEDRWQAASNEDESVNLLFLGKLFIQSMFLQNQKLFPID